MCASCDVRRGRVCGALHSLSTTKVFSVLISEVHATDRHDNKPS